LRRGVPSPVRLWVAQVPSPLWVGICNSAMTPNIEPRLEETSFTLPHRTQKPRKLPRRTPNNLHRDLPSPVRLWVAQVPSPLWVGICNSAMTRNIEPRLEERDKFHPTAPDPKTQKTTATDPQEFAQGSPKLTQAMGSPGTLALWVGIRNLAMTPDIEPRLEETNFTLPNRTPKPRKLPHRTPKNLCRDLPSLLRLWVAQVPSPYG